MSKAVRYLHIDKDCTLCHIGDFPKIFIVVLSGTLASSESELGEFSEGVRFFLIWNCSNLTCFHNVY
jgi:hypothetical protein